jgi:hypothetical protein
MTRSSSTVTGKPIRDVDESVRHAGSGLKRGLG